MSFIESNEIAERSIRRLAQSRGTFVTRIGENAYLWNGVALNDDEVWEVLSGLPQTGNRRGR